MSDIQPPAAVPLDEMQQLLFSPPSSPLSLFTVLPSCARPLAPANLCYSIPDVCLMLTPSRNTQDLISQSVGNVAKFPLLHPPAEIVSASLGLSSSLYSEPGRQYLVCMYSTSILIIITFPLLLASSTLEWQCDSWHCIYRVNTELLILSGHYLQASGPLHCPWNTPQYK